MIIKEIEVQEQYDGTLVYVLTLFEEVDVLGSLNYQANQLRWKSNTVHLHEKVRNKIDIDGSSHEINMKDCVLDISKPSYHLGLMVRQPKIWITDINFAEIARNKGIITG